ncbi:MAG TPA: archaeosortase/exosortase family protein [Polyangiaceae bacterium]
MFNVRPSAALINFFTPSEHTRAVGALLKGRTTIRIGQGCDGLECQLLFISAVLAFPLTPSRRLIGLLIGVPLLQVCNLARITGLYYVHSQWPQYFKFVHEDIGQTFMILVGCAFFIYVAGGALPIRAK